MDGECYIVDLCANVDALGKELEQVTVSVFISQQKCIVRYQATIIMKEVVLSGVSV